MSTDSESHLTVEYETFLGLTIWTEAISMQVRDDTVALHVMEGARRSSENGEPVLLSHAEARRVRDLLNMATARGML